MSAPSLRIVLISEHASPLAQAGSVDAGGQNVYVAHVAAALARRGHQLRVLTRRDSPELPAVQRLGHGVEVHHLDAGPPRFVPKEQLLPFMPEFCAQALALLRRHPCDLVHANFFMSGLAGLQLKQHLNLPLVVTFHALGAVRRQHQADDDGFPRERMALERKVAQGADRVIAECPQDRLDLMAHCGPLPGQIAEVPCGVDLLEFRPGEQRVARTRLALPQQDFIMLQLGRMVPRKGVDNVIRALAQLPGDDVRRPARLLVVGGATDKPDEVATPEIGRLRRLASRLGVASRVHFVGRRSREQLARYYQAADVFVSTPWYEPFGITPLESMACATPVIGSAVGGIQHTVVDGVTGYLVPPCDAAALAEHLDWLRQHPQQARAMGRAGLARVRRLFTWGLVAARLEAVYADVLGSRQQLVLPGGRMSLRQMPAPLQIVSPVNPVSGVRGVSGVSALPLGKAAASSAAAGATAGVKASAGMAKRVGGLLPVSEWRAKA